MYLEESNKSGSTRQRFVEFIETITPSDEAIEEINKLIEEGKKPVKKPFPYRNIESITIDDDGNWTIKGDKI